MQKSQQYQDEVVAAPLVIRDGWVKRRVRQSGEGEQGANRSHLAWRMHPFQQPQLRTDGLKLARWTPANVISSLGQVPTDSDGDTEMADFSKNGAGAQEEEESSQAISPGTPSETGPQIARISERGLVCEDPKRMPVSDTSILPLSTMMETRFSFLKYDEETYSKSLQGLSSSWTKSETDYLIDLVLRFNFKFPLVADRYAYGVPKTSAGAEIPEVDGGGAPARNGADGSNLEQAVSGLEAKKDMNDEDDGGDDVNDEEGIRRRDVGEIKERFYSVARVMTEIEYETKRAQLEFQLSSLSLADGSAAGGSSKRLASPSKVAPGAASQNAKDVAALQHQLQKLRESFAKNPFIKISYDAHTDLERRACLEKQFEVDSEEKKREARLLDVVIAIEKLIGAAAAYPSPSTKKADPSKPKHELEPFPPASPDVEKAAASLILGSDNPEFERFKAELLPIFQLQPVVKTDEGSGVMLASKLLTTSTQLFFSALSSLKPSTVKGAAPSGQGSSGAASAADGARALMEGSEMSIHHLIKLWPSKSSLLDPGLAKMPGVKDDPEYVKTKPSHAAIMAELRELDVSAYFTQHLDGIIPPIPTPLDIQTYISLKTDAAVLYKLSHHQTVLAGVREQWVQKIQNLRRSVQEAFRRLPSSSTHHGGSVSQSRHREKT